MLKCLIFYLCQIDECMEIINENIQQYCEQMTSPQSAALDELEQLSHLRTTQGNMVSGSYQGQFLTMIAAMIQAKNVLEIGTFTGFSAICLANGVAEGGKVHTIDPDIEKRYLVEEFVSKTNNKEKVVIYNGFAQEIITQKLSNEIFDLVFIDADKENYSLYFDLVIDKVRQGGIILADNVLWKGRVVEAKKDKKTGLIAAFNQKIAEDSRVTQVLLPIRDGLLMIKKNG